MMNPDELENRFRFHPATTKQRQRDHEYVRDECLSLATTLNETLPDGREKSLAVTHIETAMFWANAAIARQGQA
ncbi:hypothetical protein HII36_29810 [Nonomuraea sp. NN258]|uniref:Acb2/Tad1 domain-containing protein n=1 Tax=Nonomuraea antri TaxID=2730852 RepID=UPI001568E7F7|nr:hypothetical protein [Nonomuraea antri]NRQ35997.1 hypothetical protein [Nonomuraea antri]